MTTENMLDFIEELNTTETLLVFRTLLEDHPDLVAKAYNIAIKALGDTNAIEVADDVYSDLDMLDVDELHSRSGRTRHGYNDPIDVAWEMFEEAMDPHVEQMKKLQKRGLSAAAKNYCIGIIQGLHQFEKDAASDLMDWLEDAPGEFIYTVVEEWKKGNPSDEDIAEVMALLDDE